MNNPHQAGNECEPVVPRFGTPPSLESSYNNIFYIPREEERRGQPRLPPHLKTCVLNEISTRGGEPSSSSAPLPPHYFCPIPNGARDQSPIVIIPFGGGRFPCFSPTARLGGSFCSEPGADKGERVGGSFCSVVDVVLEGSGGGDDLMRGFDL